MHYAKLWGVFWSDQIMPTTQQEAAKVLEICQRHKLTVQQMIGIFTDLNEEVGKPSENDSVKVTMGMLADGINVMYPLRQDELPVPAQMPVHRITEINLPDKPQGLSEFPGDYGEDCFEIKLSDGLIGLVVVLHTLYGLGMLAGAAFCIGYQPWYITVLFVSFIAFMMSKEGQCLCTRLENNLRAKSGYPAVDSFYDHYYFRPAWKWLTGLLSPKRIVQ
jgi:hypothetical protein